MPKITSCQMDIVLMGWHINKMETLGQEMQRHSSTNQSMVMVPQKRKYLKLTAELKQSFLNKLIFENLSIKEASEILSINYSSAKIIAAEHRKDKMKRLRKGMRKRTAQPCTFRCLKKDDDVRGGVDQILSTVGGILVSGSVLMKMKTKPISKSGDML